MASTNYAYDLRSPSDLLNKAERELQRIHEALPWPQEQIDHAFNCAVTIWHLTDWLVKGASKELAAHGYPLNYDAFSARVRRESRALHVCHQLATGSKHFALDQIFKGERVQDTDTSVVAQAVVPGEMVLKVYLDNGTSERVVTVFGDALGYWERLFAKCGL